MTMYLSFPNANCDQTMLTSEIKILVVDDSSVTRETLQSYFAEEGYSVDGVDTAEAAEQRLSNDVYDLVLLDIRLPGKDGLTLTRELRSRSEIGIILVTGKQDEIDRIIGLECGADEYVCKPFNPREILARGKNLIRRVRAQRDMNKFTEEPVLRTLGPWHLDTSRRVLVRSDRTITQLTEGEFQLLLALMEHEGTPLSRDQLMDRIKNRTWNATDRTIDVLIGRIRRKLAEDPDCPPMIITVHGVGYLFSVSAIEDEPCEP
ncbi:response regulator [Marinomonas atlantica]|uniref:response regulator n=1 Tax=Marinomonas atlantica TaxID=1806668 RepID=UPI0022B23074|nr:response regulator transcription factor [Marinomonas atlantica]